MQRKVSTTVYLTPRQDRDLHTLSELTRRAMSVYIRDAIDLVIERERAAGNLPPLGSETMEPATGGLQ
jgi:hypothetical protein